MASAVLSYQPRAVKLLDRLRSCLLDRIADPEQADEHPIGDQEHHRPAVAPQILGAALEGLGIDLELLEERIVS